MVGAWSIEKDAAGGRNHNPTDNMSIQLLLSTLIVLNVTHPMYNLRVHYLYHIDVVGTYWLTPISGPSQGERLPETVLLGRLFGVEDQIQTPASPGGFLSKWVG